MVYSDLIHCGNWRYFLVKHEKSTEFTAERFIYDSTKVTREARTNMQVVVVVVVAVVGRPELNSASACVSQATDPYDSRGLGNSHGDVCRGRGF